MPLEITALARIKGLVAALAGKSDVGHDHTTADLTDVITAGAAAGDILVRDGSEWRKSTPVWFETPSGTVNGTNVVFNLASFPISATLVLMRNGVVQVPGVDFTISGKTITWTAAPLTGSVIRANYWTDPTPPYVPFLPTFDGTADSVQKTTSGLANGTGFILSFVMDIDGSDTTARCIFDNGSAIIIDRKANGKLGIQILNTSFAALLTAESATSVLAAGGQLHVMLACNFVSTPVVQCYFNGVAETLNPSSGPTAGTVLMQRPFNAIQIGELSGGGNKFLGGLTDIWFNDSFTDISVLPTRQNFYDGGPKNPLLTLPQPKIALGFSMDLAAWNNSPDIVGLGSIQNWTRNGTFT